MHILEFYEATLDALFLKADKEGLVSCFPPKGGQGKPWMIDGKRVSLPTKFYLRRQDGDDFQAFHPLSENLARGQSPVLREVTKYVKRNTIYYIAELSTLLMQIACNPQYQNALPASWSNFFKRVKDADEKTEKAFHKVLKKALDHKSAIVSVFLKNNGEIDDDRFLRTCNVKFDLLKEIESKTPFNVKLRAKDVDVMVAVLETILPNIATKNAYSTGTNSDIAPYFVALLRTYSKLADHFNATLKMLKSVDHDLKPVPVDFKEGLMDITTYYNQIPSLKGNEGDLIKGTQGDKDEDVDQVLGTSPVKETPAPKPRQASPAPVQQQQQPAQANSWRTQPAQPQQQWQPPVPQQHYAPQPQGNSWRTNSPHAQQRQPQQQWADPSMQQPPPWNVPGNYQQQPQQQGGFGFVQPAQPTPQWQQPQGFNQPQGQAFGNGFNGGMQGGYGGGNGIL